MGQENQTEGFAVTQRKGFHVTFENGYTVSVQFGAGNYGDNYYRRFDRDDAVPPSRRAEVASWDRSGVLLKLSYSDDVAAYQTPAQVLAIMNRVAALPGSSER